MIKLLIADDEPLVCVGIQSMLKWEDYGIEIAGTARNGQQAAELIESLRPELVITDIKMPFRTGLDLAEECSRKYGKLPLFIILTSFEEFEFVRRAIGIQAVDYLVKLELTAEILAASITKAVSMLDLIRWGDAPVAGQRLQGLWEKFFFRLCNNLFESREQFLVQKEELALDFSSPAYAAVFGEIQAARNGVGDASLALYTSSIQMVREMLEKRRHGYVTALDIRHFIIISCLDSGDGRERRELLKKDLDNTIAIIHNYFNVPIRMAVGKEVDDPFRLDESYLSARRAFRETSAESALKFFDASPEKKNEEFAFSRVRPAIRRAFEELDTAALEEVLGTIHVYFKNRPELRVEAMDAACSILYMAIGLLPQGEQTVEDIFAGENDGYRSIYRMRSADAVMAWLKRLGEGCCARLLAQRYNYKQQVVANVQEYIRHNLTKRLSLHEVSAVFNVSPNYLSQLFTKYAGEGFVEYITQAKIHAAREMLIRGEGPIYDIAEKLGYESAFYFSKVFKKVEGVSPREFLRKMGKLS
jgi:two-component system response regulator YesN